MRRYIVWTVLFFAGLLFCFTDLLYAQTARKSGTEQKQKGAGAKIVIEYVSFPDVLKRYDVYPWETLAIEEFKKAYIEMLGQKSQETWINSLTGTGDKNRILYVAKEHLLLIAICKPHFCDENQLLVLFNPVRKKCYAISAGNGKFDYLGAPEDNMKNLLKILLVDEYKDIYKGQ
jgi:hypothetical protein